MISFPIIETLFTQASIKLRMLEEKLLRSSCLTDLTLGEVRVIQSIELYKARKMSEVARELNITPGALTPTLDRLVHKGYVSRSGDEDDRRVILVRLTEKGEQAFKVHSDIHLEITQIILSNLSIEEGEVLINALEHINKSLDDYNFQFSKEVLLKNVD